MSKTVLMSDRPDVEAIRASYQRIDLRPRTLADGTKLMGSADVLLLLDYIDILERNSRCTRCGETESAHIAAICALHPANTPDRREDKP